MFDHLKKKYANSDHILHKDDIIRHHTGSTFSEREVNIVLLIILAVILLLFWIPLAEFIH